MHFCERNRTLVEMKLPASDGGFYMEKVYLSMKNAGIFNVVFGILLAVGSVLTAVGSAFLIMHGARLIKKKSELLF